MVRNLSIIFNTKTSTKSSASAMSNESSSSRAPGSATTYNSSSLSDKNERSSDTKQQQILLNTMENKDYMIIQALYRKDNHMILDNTKDVDDPNNQINLKSIGDSLEKNHSIMRAKHKMLLKIAGRPTE